MDNFLTFFALRGLDEEFCDKFNGKLSFSTPSNVILNGLDDKIYDINNVDDIFYIGPCHKAKKNKTLSDLLPLKGSIRISNLTDQFRRIRSRDSSDSSHQRLRQYKLLWENFLKVVLVIREMGLECDEQDMASIHFRKLSVFNERPSHDNFQQIFNEMKDECIPPP